MLVPSQNPDGVDIVGDYYRSTLGTPSEGRDPPDLYHKYVGHDDNRDWYAFTQPETRYTVDSLYTPWDPQIVNDIHQQGSNAGRIFIPPYMDPIEPNIDPILTAATNGLGMSIVWRMTNQGFTGIAQQRVVRSVVAGAAVLALPSRRAPAHRDGERASRDADRHSVRSARHGPRLRRARPCRGTFRRCGRAATGRTATSCATRPPRAGRSSSTRR